MGLREKEAKTAISWLASEMPEGRQTLRQVALSMDLNSAHITHLFRYDYLTPALERGLIIKKALGPRPDPVPVEPCPECGEVHILIHCPHGKRAHHKRRPRFTVAADDSEMAFQQLEKYYPGMFSLKSERSGA